MTATAPRTASDTATASARARLVPTGRAARLLTGGPRRLRLIALVGGAGALVVALGGGWALVGQAQALELARASAAHGVLVDGLRTSVLRADAAATTAFLQPGPEPVAQRREYLALVAAAARDLAAAGRTASGDGAVGPAGAVGAVGAAGYGRANQALTTYTGLIEAARTSDRHDLPIGATYLRSASALLRSDVLPDLAAASALDTAQVRGAYAAAHSGDRVFLGCAAAGLVLLAGAQFALARLTRRVFSVPAALTGLLLTLTAVLAGTLSVSAVRAADTIRSGDLARSSALAGARAAAFDARATESLVLIGRGAYPDGEQRWLSAFGSARQQAAVVGQDLVTPLDAYGREHAQVRARDGDGDWAPAVAQALAVAPGSATRSLAAFDTRSVERLGACRRGVLDGLADAREPLLWAAPAVVATGTAAVLGLGLGVARRLGEYR